MNELILLACAYIGQTSTSYTIHFILFLFIASWKGHIEIVKELLNRNANIEAEDKDGWTSLMWGIFLNELFICNSFIYFNFYL